MPRHHTLTLTTNGYAFGDVDFTATPVITNDDTAHWPDGPFHHTVTTAAQTAGWHLTSLGTYGHTVTEFKRILRTLQGALTRLRARADDTPHLIALEAWDLDLVHQEARIGWSPKQAPILEAINQTLSEFVASGGYLAVSRIAFSPALTPHPDAQWAAGPYQAAFHGESAVFPAPLADLDHEAEPARAARDAAAANNEPPTSDTIEDFPEDLLHVVSLLGMAPHRTAALVDVSRACPYSALGVLKYLWADRHLVTVDVRGGDPQTRFSRAFAGSYTPQGPRIDQVLDLPSIFLTLRPGVGRAAHEQIADLAGQGLERDGHFPYFDGRRVHPPVSVANEAEVEDGVYDEYGCTTLCATVTVPVSLQTMWGDILPAADGEDGGPGEGQAAPPVVLPFAQERVIVAETDPVDGMLLLLTQNVVWEAGWNVQWVLFDQEDVDLLTWDVAHTKVSTALEDLRADPARPSLLMIGDARGANITSPSWERAGDTRVRARARTVNKMIAEFISLGGFVLVGIGAHPEYNTHRAQWLKDAARLSHKWAFRGGLGVSYGADRLGQPVQADGAWPPRP